MQGSKVMQIYVGMFFLNDLLEIDWKLLLQH